MASFHCVHKFEWHTSHLHCLLLALSSTTATLHFVLGTEYTCLLPAVHTSAASAFLYIHIYVTSLPWAP